MSKKCIKFLQFLQLKKHALYTDNKKLHIVFANAALSFFGFPALLYVF